MKRLWQRFIEGVFVGVGFLAIIGLIPTGYAAAIALLTNATVQFPAVLPDLNNLISTLNAQVTGFLAFNNSTSETGEVALTDSRSWIANGSVATSVTSVGPAGAHTTVQEWLVFVDNNGNARYVPAF